MVLPPALVGKVDQTLVERLASPAGIRWFEGGADALWDDALVAWDPFSGRPVPREALARLLPQSISF